MTISLLQLDLVVFAVYIYVYLLHGPTSGEVSGMDEHIARRNFHLCKKEDKKGRILAAASEKG